MRSVRGKEEKDRLAAEFQTVYPKFKSLTKTAAFRLILEYLLVNQQKMEWAIDDLDIPPIEGVGKGLLALKVDFEDANMRRLAGALVAFILSDRYEPVSSGHRIRWRPFITASKYQRITKKVRRK